MIAWIFTPFIVFTSAVEMLLSIPTSRVTSAHLRSSSGLGRAPTVSTDPSWSDADLCQGTGSSRSQMVGRGAHTTHHPSIPQPNAGISRLVVKCTRWVVFGRGVERHGHSSSGNAAAATGGNKWRVKNGGMATSMVLHSSCPCGLGRSLGQTRAHGKSTTIVFGVGAPDGRTRCLLS